MLFSVQRSKIDPQYLEVVQNGVVEREIRVPFLIKKKIPCFDSLSDLEAWLIKTEKELAKRAAYYWLAGRSYPKMAILKKLEEKKFSSKICCEVVSELEKLGYLSDADFLQMAIEREWRKGYGPRYIEMKLRLQGLEVGSVRDRIDEKRQEEAIGSLLAKIGKKERSKKIQALLRRGFDLEVILKIVD